MKETKYTWPYANEAGQEEVIESDVLVLGGMMFASLKNAD